MTHLSHHLTPFNTPSHVRFLGISSQTFGTYGRGHAHNQQTGRTYGWRGVWTGRGGQGRGGFPGGGEFLEERVPTLEVCIQRAADAAYLLPNLATSRMYDLAKRADTDAQRGLQYRSKEHARVVDAAKKLFGRLLGSSSFSVAPASTSSSPVLQLDNKCLSQLAWSLSVMVRFDVSLFSAGAQQLCYAVAERAAQPGIIRANAREACRSWAGVLFGLAEAGVKCSNDARVKRVFHFCMERELPDLLLEGQRCLPQDVSMLALACVDAEYEGSVQPFISALARRVGDPSMGGVGGGLMAKADPQNWSNLIYACAKLKQRGILEGEGVDEGMSIIAAEVAISMVSALRKPVKDQPNYLDLAHTLWGLSYLEWYNARITSALAHAVVDRIASSTPQGLSNTLWALSSKGWYDSVVYDALLGGLLDKSNQCDSQAISNVIYSCAVASHGGSAINELAQVTSRQDVSEGGGWIDQHLANSLYAWAVLGSIGNSFVSLNTMAQHLMREVNARGPAAFQPMQLPQLYLAHLEAKRVGLQGGGLSTGNGMLQAAAERHTKYQAELRKKARQSGGGAAGVRQAAAALQESGYEVELGGGIGKDQYHADLLVRHESCPRGIAVDVLSGKDRLRHPPGQLKGMAKLKHAQIRQRCNGLVVLSEADAKQPGLVVQRLEEVMKGGPAIARRKSKSL